MALYRQAFVNVLVVAAMAAAVLAQDSGDMKRLASLDLMKLGEIQIISAARHEQNRAASPRSVSVITREEIRRRNYRNVPEALAAVTGVFLQQTNYAGGSPVLRGMIGNRILIMVNGIRMNNGTYRFGPNQYLNQIDINVVERIEVVRGAGSVLYGSDAFGGVVNVITRSAPDPLLGGELDGGVRGRYGSADASGAGRLELSGAAGKVGFFGGVTREGFGDLWGGSGVGRQRWTGYSQQAGDLQLRIALAAEKSLSIGLMRLTQSGVPRTDVLTAGTDLEYTWDPEGHDMVWVQYAQSKVNRYIDALQITAAYQRPSEFISRITASSPARERRYADDVLQGSLAMQFTSRPLPHHLLTYGIEDSSDRVASSRTDVDLTSGARVATTGNYPDGSRFGSTSVFVQDELEIGKRVHAVVGGRFDSFRIRADTQDAAVGRVAIRSSPSAWTGSGQLLYDLTPWLSATAGISQGFRAPNLDDSTVIGGVSQRFEIPNPSLLPERSVNREFGIRAKAKRGNLSAVYFDDVYRDLIDPTPSLLKGLSFVDVNGNGVKDAKELDVYQRQNIGRAVVRGIEADGVVKLSNAWTWMQTVAWTYGRDTLRSTPLTRIPPMTAQSRLVWQPNRTLWMEFAGNTAAAQKRLSPGDIADVRIGPRGTAGFAVFHVRAGLNRTCLSGLSIAWENVTNRRYRLHGSGFYRPGSSVVIAYERSFRLR